MTKYYGINKQNAASTQALAQMREEVKAKLIALKDLEGLDYIINLTDDVLGQKLKPCEMDESECTQMLESGKLPEDHW